MPTRRRFRLPAVPRRLRRTALAVVVAVVVPASAVLAAPAPLVVPDPAPFPSLPALPANPVDAATALVELVHGPDATVAAEATGELLRRAGIPLLATDGPVVALPDGPVLADAAIYAPLAAQLATATRRGDFYTPEQLADLMTGLGLTTAPLPVETLVGGLGAWGKHAGSPVESQFAGAAVRALAGIRLEVLYPKAEPSSIHLDPLQVTLVLAHLSSGAYPHADAAVGDPSPLARLLGLGVARAAAGPCDEFAKKVKLDENTVEGVAAGKYRDTLVDSWKDFVLNEKGKEVLETAGKVHEKGTAVLNTLLLLMGAQLDLNDDKGGLTHYRHSDGDHATDVKLTARARFDSTIAKEHVACYGLAGIEVPPPGPLEGFRVRWYIDQPIGRGYQGKHVAPVRGDSEKFLATGGGGEVTGSDGTSRVTLETAVERNPGKGKELKGHATVTASLDKDDFPFKLSDLLSLGPKFAAKKTFDLVVSAVQRAGLPSQRRVIQVKYHGTNILVAKGQTTLFAFYYLLPVYLDIYTCEGFEGQWQGKGGFRAESTFFATAANKVFGVSFPKDFQGGKQLSFTPHIANGVGRFDIVPPTFNGIMTVDGGRQYWQQDFQPVGEVEVQIQGNSVDPLAVFDGRGAHWPIIQVPEHPDCPEGGSYFP